MRFFITVKLILNFNAASCYVCIITGDFLIIQEGNSNYKLTILYPRRNCKGKGKGVPFLAVKTCAWSKGIASLFLGLGTR